MFETYKQLPTKPGWYCLGFDREDQKLQEDIGPYMTDMMFFDGEFWYDEDQNEITSIYDPLMGIQVSANAADYFVPQ